MSKKIIIDGRNEKVNIGLLERGKLMEFHSHYKDEESLLQNVYIGKVKNKLKGMQAAFVDINLDKNGYLYLEKDMQQIKAGDELMVQVVKEPIGSKGAVLTTKVSVPGNYLVITPYDKRISISSKITDIDEKERLKETVAKYKQMDVGFIIRTDAVGKEASVLEKEISLLETQWKKIIDSKDYRTCYSLLYRDLTPTLKTVRDLLVASIDEVIVNDKASFDKITDYVSDFLPEYLEKIKFYDQEGSLDLFDVYKINSQLKKALNKKVWLNNGGCLVIEQTEALVSIDVNSAKFTGKKNLEETIYKVNSEAVEVICQQLRLRNLSGIIIIDFIDMKKDETKEKLIRLMKRTLQKDRYKTVVYGMTNLGLFEMSRKKTHESLENQMMQVCPCCNGRGKINKEGTLN